MEVQFVHLCYVMFLLFAFLNITAVFWIEDSQYIAKEDTTQAVTIHRSGNLANADTLSKCRV